MPPTDDCTKNFKTLQNLEKQKMEYLEKRSRDCREKEMPLGEFVSRKRPEKRNDQFIDRDTGLPRPYGKHSEFFPNKSNLKRHFKNMKPLAKIVEETNENVKESKEKILEL